MEPNKEGASASWDSQNIVAVDVLGGKVTKEGSCQSCFVTTERERGRERSV